MKLMMISWFRNIAGQLLI